MAIVNFVASLVIASALFSSFVAATEDVVSLMQVTRSDVKARNIGTSNGVTVELLKTFESPNCTLSVAFSPCGSRLAAGDCDNKTRIYDATNTTRQGWKMPFVLADTGPVSGVAFRHDQNHGLLLGAADLEGNWLLYNASTSLPFPTLLSTGSLGKPIKGIAIARDAPLMATSVSEGNLFLWDISDPTAPVRLQEAAFEGAPTIPALTSSGDRLSVGIHQDTVYVWSINSTGLFLGEKLTVPAHVNQVAFSPDNTMLAAAVWDNSAMLFGETSLLPLSKMNAEDSVNSVAFSTDGTLLATGGSEGILRIYDITLPTAPQLLASLDDAADALKNVAFGERDGQIILAAGGSEKKVRLYQITKA